ncbi:MAG: hypothetical protein AAGA15_08760 [Pseudomonadota bacterium]
MKMELFDPADASKPSSGAVISLGDCELDCGELHVSFPEVTITLLQCLRPRVVYSPLVHRDFDTAELAVRLQECGFTGLYCAIAEQVHFPALVRADVQRLAPNVHFELIVLNEARSRVN